jgi:hypothetical protein
VSEWGTEHKTAPYFIRANARAKSRFLDQKGFSETF